MKSEHSVQNDIRNDLAGECLLFRANVGQAWTGSAVKRLPGGRVLIEDARPFSTGLPPGFSDLFGGVTEIITPDMIGQKFLRFLAGETKTAKGRVSEQQQAFLAAILNNGGRAGVWRSIADARETVFGSIHISK